MFHDYSFGSFYVLEDQNLSGFCCVHCKTTRHLGSGIDFVRSTIPSTHFMSGLLSKSPMSLRPQKDNFQERNLLYNKQIIKQKNKQKRASTTAMEDSPTMDHQVVLTVPHATCSEHSRVLHGCDRIASDMAARIGEAFMNLGVMPITLLGDVPREVLDLNRPEARDTEMRQRLLDALYQRSVFVVLDIHSYSRNTQKLEWPMYILVNKSHPNASVRLAETIEDTLKPKTRHGLLRTDGSSKNDITHWINENGRHPALTKRKFKAIESVMLEFYEHSSVRVRDEMAAKIAEAVVKRYQQARSEHAGAKHTFDNDPLLTALLREDE